MNFADRNGGLEELRVLLEGNRLIHVVGRRLPVRDIAAALSERAPT